MAPLNYERLAVTALDALLAGGLEITQRLAAQSVALSIKHYTQFG